MQSSLTEIAQTDASVTVVVPAYNCAATIAQTIQHLLAQTVAPAAIIIVNDGSTDDTASVVKQFSPYIQYLEQPNAGPAAARNTGIRAAQTELIAFTDSDCFPTSDWLAALLTGFTDDRIVGVGGIVRGNEKNMVSSYIDHIHLLDVPRDEQGNIPYLITANACFRRAGLLQVGLFDERYRRPGGEEPELCLRLRQAGYIFASNSAAVVHHHHRQTSWGLIKTLFQYGRGSYLTEQITNIRQQPRPWHDLRQHLFALRSLLRRIRQRQSQLGLLRAITFAWFDYLRPIAYLLGYLIIQQKTKCNHAMLATFFAATQNR